MKKILSTLLALLLVATMAGSACLPVFAAATEEATSAAPETAPETETAAPETDTAEPDTTAPDEPLPEDPAPDAPAPVDPAALEVIARTLTLNENVWVKYAVPVSDADVKMMFWTEEQTEYTAETAVCIADPVGTEEVLGTMSFIFRYEELMDQQMTDVLYARAFVETDGEYVYGEVNKYSILQYAYNKLNAEEVDPALEETLTELLDRGAEAQIAENYKTDDLANEPHSQVHVVDDVMSDGFSDFLNPDSKEITGIDRYMITTDGAIFYLEYDIVVTGYQFIENYLYYFEDILGAKCDTVYDYHEFDRKGRVVADLEFVTVEDNTYYFIAQQIVYDYQLINNLLYFFGEDGVMAANTVIDGYTVNAEGQFVGSEIFIDTGDNVFYLVDNIVIYIYVYIEGELFLDLNGNLYPTTDYESTVFESDSDEVADNNETLEGVECIARIEELDITFTVTTDEEGNFVFPNLPRLEIIFIFVFDGYINGEITIDLADEEVELLPSIVLDKNVSNNLTGKVTIADTDTNFGNNASLAGATVTLERLSSLNELFLTTTTDSNGNYSFGELTAGVYRLVVIIEGYVTVNQIVNIRDNQSNVQNAVIEAIPDTGDTEGVASGIINDARTGLAISGIKVVIRRGLNNTTGEILMTLVTNSNGLFTTEGLLPGNYTAQVVDDRELTSEDYRFGSIVIAIKVIGGVTISNQNATTSNSVGLDVDGMRVVLTWGSSPSDLDSYTKVTLANGYSETVYYGKQNGYYADLDVDDTTGYGPETTTVDTSRDGIYKFYVHQYSAGGSLAYSGGKVEIYLGSTTPAYTLYVPQGSGRYWNVFTYNSTTGEITITNTVSSYVY